MSWLSSSRLLEALAGVSQVHWETPAVFCAGLRESLVSAPTVRTVRRAFRAQRNSHSSVYFLPPRRDLMLVSDSCRSSEQEVPKCVRPYPSKGPGRLP